MVPGPAERRALIERARLLVEAMEVRHSAEIFTATPGPVLSDLLRPPGEDAEPADDVLSRLTTASQFGWDKAQGGDLAYIPSGGLFTGAVGAWLASAIHAFTGAAFEAPALVAMEESVLRWVAGTLGMPGDAEGILLSGGSLANQTAIACAREHGRTGPTPRVYLTPRVHHSVRKGLRLSGIPDAEARSMAVDSDGRVDLPGLRRQLARDRADGARPWLLVAVAGDTDTGAIDPLSELADIAAEHAAWFHVDAAYGGFFTLTERGNERMRGIERADSVTVDAHKSLFLPYGIGGLIVNHPGALIRAHAADGAYLRDVEDINGLPHYFGLGPENTRPFRGLLAWLPLHLHGIAAFRETLDRMLDLAVQAAENLKRIPGIDVPRDPELSITLFRASDGDQETQRILGSINNSGRFHVSSTTIDGRVTIRLAFLHPRTDRDLLDDLVALVERARQPYCSSTADNGATGSRQSAR
jgi:aromatic-L-amino-acid/L-tryptophan decarboxylase